MANIGDSRLYIVGGTEQIRQITRDHSLVDEMVRMGEINADEARVHPDKNIITRAVGAADHVEADFFVFFFYVRTTGFFCVQTDLPIW